MRSHFSSDRILSRHLILSFKEKVLIQFGWDYTQKVELETLRVAVFGLECKVKPKSLFIWSEIAQSLQTWYNKLMFPDLWNSKWWRRINDDQRTSTGCFRATSSRVRGTVFISHEIKALDFWCRGLQDISKTPLKNLTIDN